MPLSHDISSVLKRKRDKVYLNSISSGSLQLSYIKIEPGEKTYHSHKNEQAGYILKGNVEIIIDNEKYICKSGDAYIIPPNINHGFTVLGDNPVEYIEVFHPPKE